MVYTPIADCVAESEAVFAYVRDQLRYGLKAEDARLFEIWTTDPDPARRAQALIRLRARASTKRLGDTGWPTAGQLGLRSEPDLMHGSLSRGIGEKELFVDRAGMTWMGRTGDIPGISYPGRTEYNAHVLADALGFDVAPGVVRNNKFVQQLYVRDGIQLVDPISMVGPFQAKVAKEGFFRDVFLRSGLDYSELSEIQLQQFKEFMVLDWMVGNTDVHTNQFILDTVSDRFIHVDFERSFGEILSGFTWEDPFYGTNVGTYIDGLALNYGAMVTQAQGRSPFRRIGLSIEDFQDIFARIESLDHARWERRLDYGLNGYRDLWGVNYVQFSDRVIQDGTTSWAYGNRMRNVREAFTEYLESKNLTSTFDGDLGVSLQGRASATQVRKVRAIMEGPEVADYPIWARRAPEVADLSDEVKPSAMHVISDLVCPLPVGLRGPIALSYEDVLCGCGSYGEIDLADFPTGST